MVKHIVVWNFDESSSAEDNRKLALRMKEDLENLKEVISGLVEIKLAIDLLPTSNADILLDSTFESEEALSAYQVHPEHKKIVEYAAHLLKHKKCVDFIV